MTEKIIYNKFKTKYNNYYQASKVIGQSSAKIIYLKGGTPPFCNISKLALSLGYTFQDFLIDYKDHLSNFSVNNYFIIFQIYSNESSLFKYSIQVGISQTALYNFLTKKSNNLLVQWKILWIINKDKLPFESNIDFIKKDGYAKIIGNRDTLEELKKLYSIPYPVLYYSNDLCHIAFWWI